MLPLSDLIAQGSTNVFFLFPCAVLLGALHGLEPGHSKTMMAAFIVAVRGTVAQAVMLGLSATVSHTFVVWVVALGGLYLGQGENAQVSEPYFQFASAVIVIGVALWMFARLRHAHGHGCCGHAHTHNRQAVPEGKVTAGQIVIFGLTGGLIPCPAAITVLLICLQLKKVALGATLVLGFSVGLAVTLVSVGVAAAVGMRHAAARYPAFEKWAAKAPYVSAALILVLGTVLAVQSALAF